MNPYETWKRRLCLHGFSLIELMIVIVILGALTGIIVPMFTYSEVEAKGDAVLSEMSRIRRAYIDFYNDNFPHNDELGHLSFFGLYPLCSTNEPTGYNGIWHDAVRGEYDPYNDLGWNGPYLMQEARKTVDVEYAGQGESSSGTVIPVVNDPYGGYYRVLLSVSNKLSLICTGRNLELNTDTNRVDSAGWITNQVDDTALSLLPFN